MTKEVRLQASFKGQVATFPYMLWKYTKLGQQSRRLSVATKEVGLHASFEG
jgi:hypothetical protein